MGKSIFSAIFGVLETMDIIDWSRHISNRNSDLIFEFCKTLPEKDWEEFTFRQNTFSAHTKTKTLCAIWPDRKDYPNIKLDTFKHTIKLLELFDPVIKDFCDYYKKSFSVVTAMVVRLDSDEDVKEHSDTHPFFGITHRVHWCIDGDYDNMDFLISGNKIEMNKDAIIEINNRLPHSVKYYGKTPRYNAILDFYPTET